MFYVKEAPLYQEKPLTESLYLIVEQGRSELEYNHYSLLPLLRLRLLRL